MANPLVGQCPVCERGLEVTRLHCSSCGTSLEGRFELCSFCRLNREQQEFVQVFIKCRGNIKEVERELGISYPTVRGRLDNVIAALGYRVEPGEPVVAADTQAKAGRRKEILEALNRGELTPEEAVKQLKQL